MPKKRIAVWSATLTLAACASQETLRVDDLALAQVTAEQRAELQRQEGALEDAREALETARRELASARLQLAEARDEADLDEARLEALDEQTELATELSLEAPLQSLQGQRTRLRLILAESKAMSALARAELDYARAQVDLHEAEVALADARRETARAEAAKATDSPLAATIAVSDFKAQLASAQKKAGRAQTTTAKLARAVEAAKRAHEQALAMLPEDAGPAPEVVRIAKERERLVGQVKLLEQRIRELERENSRLMNRVVQVPEPRPGS